MTGFTRFARSYLDLWLLVGGAAAAVAALLLLALAPGVGGYLPIGLLLDGGVAIGGSIAIQFRRREPSPRDPSPDSGESLSFQASKPPGPGLRDAEPWAPVPRSGIARAAVSVHPGRATLGTWWRRGASESLDLSSGGSVPANAPAASRSGGFFSFHSSARPVAGRARGPSAGYSASATGSAGARPLSSPFSPAELDRLFPVERDVPIETLVAGRAATPSEPPRAVGEPGSPPISLAAPAGTAEAPASPESFPGTSRTPTTDSAGRPIRHLLPDRFDRSGAERRSVPPVPTSSPRLLLEVANPVPPHLRGAAARDHRQVPSAVPRRTTPTDGSLSCGSCTRPLSDFRAWSPCVQCGQPICRRCLGQSFGVGEQGLCWDCSDPVSSPAS